MFSATIRTGTDAEGGARSAAQQADTRNMRLALTFGLRMAGSVRIVAIERQMRRNEQIVDLLKQGEDEGHVRLPAGQW
jgi:hypothetical protein